MLCSLVLVNCSCEEQPEIACSLSDCWAEDGNCQLEVWVWEGYPIVKALPMGPDALVYEGKDKIDETSIALREQFRVVDYYTYSYTPVDPSDGAYGYLLQTQDALGRIHQCTGTLPATRQGMNSLSVALQEPFLVLDNESGPVPLPEYWVDGPLSEVAEGSWSANEPDWAIIEEGGTQYLRYMGTAREASSPSAATLTVSATGSDGTRDSASVALAARYVHPSLELNQEYALPGDDIVATYWSGLDDNGETDGNGATWELLLTPEGGQTVDKSSELLTTALPEERHFVAGEVGRYTVKRTRAGTDGDVTLSEVVTVLEPVVNVVFRPPPAIINMGELVLFDASGSTVPPGAELWWAVTERPGGSSVEMVPDVNAKRATLTPDVMEGTYTVEARLKLPSRPDPIISSQSFSFVSTPVAGPVTDETEHWVGDEVSFDLDRSSYPGGSSFKYTLSSAPEGSNAELVISADGTQASLITDVAGGYEVELTITNAEGETSSHVTSITAEESSAVPLILSSALPVVDDDGDLSVIVIDIDGDNRLTATAAQPAVGPDTALFLYGYWSGENSANLYDSSGEPFALVNLENGAVLDADVGHTIQLKRDNGAYYQLQVTFETGDMEGDATVTALSGYYCGESLSDCP